jgi:simple sugar transport system ATP-binding protein
VDHVSFNVHAGQILGIAGVQGNGQTELVEAITGLDKAASGKVLFKGQDITNAPPRKVTEVGSAHVPEDRQADGLVLPFPVAENLVLCTFYKEPMQKALCCNTIKSSKTLRSWSPILTSALPVH